MAEEWMKWNPVIEKLLWQSYYRIFGVVSFPGPIDESFKSAEYLSANTELKGSVYWQSGFEGRVFRWDNIELSPGIVISVWGFGSPTRKRNTVLLRRGWWSFYIFDIVDIIVENP